MRNSCQAAGRAAETRASRESSQLGGLELGLGFWKLKWTGKFILLQPGSIVWVGICLQLQVEFLYEVASFVMVRREVRN
jgi:hypothetical protein